MTLAVADEIVIVEGVEVDTQPIVDVVGEAHSTGQACGEALRLVVELKVFVGIIKARYAKSNSVAVSRQPVASKAAAKQMISTGSSAAVFSGFSMLTLTVAHPPIRHALTDNMVRNTVTLLFIMVSISLF